MKGWDFIKFSMTKKLPQRALTHSMGLKNKANLYLYQELYFNILTLGNVFYSSVSLLSLPQNLRYLSNDRLFNRPKKSNVLNHGLYEKRQIIFWMKWYIMLEKAKKALQIKGQ